MKLVDAGDSKSPAARRAGSIPAPGTTYKKPLSFNDLTAFSLPQWSPRNLRFGASQKNDWRKNHATTSESTPVSSRLRGEMAALALDRGAPIQRWLQSAWRPASLVISLPQYLASHAAGSRHADRLVICLHEAGRLGGNVMSLRRVKADQNTKLIQIVRIRQQCQSQSYIGYGYRKLILIALINASSST